MKIAGRGGHNAGVPGAHGILDEVTEDRKYWYSLMEKLRSRGHEVLDCTPGNTKTSAEDLSYGVNKANNWKADLFISCHMNAGGGSGSEVIFCPGSIKGKEYAEKVQKSLVSLGFANRKAYADVRGLYEPKHTKMPCIIVEPFFLDNEKDAALYRKLGYDKIAEAIAEGVTGQTITTSSQTAYKTVTASILNVRSTPTPNGDNIIGKLQKGEKVHISNINANGFTNIYFGDHGGWVSTQYLL